MFGSWHKRSEKEDKMSENQVEEMFKKTATPAEYFSEYCAYLGKLLNSLDHQVIEEVTELILKQSERSHTIFFIGNGGSAATASHFALDLVECSQLGPGLHFRPISLADSAPLLTAFGNDKGYEEVFASQVRNYLHEGDVLIAISASGNSPNIIAAVKKAKELGGITVGLAGFDGGELIKICDHTIHVRTSKGEYGPVEDVHLALDHMITAYIRMKIVGPRT